MLDYGLPWPAEPGGRRWERDVIAVERAPALYLGVDLGQVNDYTALAIAEQVPIDRTDEHTYNIRHLERLPLGMSYVKQVAHVAALLATPRLRDARLVVDQTGVGRAVVDFFRAANLRPTGIVIHGGNEVIREGQDYHVPKRDLVAAVQVALQGGRLKIAGALPEAATLTKELQAFEVKLSQAGHDSYSAREGEHDDLILAVAVALWLAEQGHAGVTIL
jgi:hypothetical protein